MVHQLSTKRGFVLIFHRVGIEMTQGYGTPAFSVSSSTAKPFQWTNESKRYKKKIETKLLPAGCGGEIKRPTCSTKNADAPFSI